MTAQQTLPTDRAHDLPPTWDGFEVEWRGWVTAPAMMHICPPRKPEACQACGSLAVPVINHGRLYAKPSEVLRPIGKARLGKLKVGAWLTAFRCTDCRHDTVLESPAARLWVLDESDYAADGSWER